jgi:surfactin synthase thioesterase subunit
MTAWIRRLHRNPDGPVRLVLFPYAGGAASSFMPFSASLSDVADVLCVQYPGRHERWGEPAIDNVADLAAGVLPAIPIDRPIVLFGHSLGASVAFEVARLLEGSGVIPRSLLVSARRAPNVPSGEHPVHTRDDDGIIAELKTLAGTDPRVLDEPELLSMILPTMRTDYKAAETYLSQPDPLLRCPITALTGDDDPKLTLDHVRAWAEFTAGRFKLEIFTGGHFYLTDHHEGVVSVITRELGG